MLPIPVSLRAVARQFDDADEHNVASDLARDYTTLIEAAWDGSMCQSIVGRRIPLADAIQRGVPDFDAAALAYMTTVVPQIQAMVGSAFDSTKFIQDLLHVFKALKGLNFTGFGTMHYEHIQAVLTESEEVWRCGSFKDEVFVVQQFALRVVQLTESLKQRTGRCIANDDVKEAASAVPNPPRGRSMEVEKQLVYNAAAGRIYGSRDWPQCVNGPFNWTSLFGEHNWITPRMAASIHHAATVFSDFDVDDPPRLPKVARPFLKQSKEWRESFRDCHLRIAMRLQKGLDPQPNCTGEEMAFHNIMYLAPDAYDAIHEEIDELPENPNDEEYGMVRENGVEDEDVLMLFGDGDDDDDDDDEVGVDNPVLGPGSVADFMLGSPDVMRVAHLHPSEWFHAFKEERFRDHLP